MEALFYCDLKAIEEYAKEIKDLKDISMVIFDRPENIKSNLGQLQKNRILGIFLWLKETTNIDITTNKIETEYKKFFREISRSSISNYLNQLEKENVLIKEKRGKEVYYKIAHELPDKIEGDPFWFVKNFCIYPIYICRNAYFARKLRIEKNKEEAFILKLINYNLIRNRLNKCSVCPFGIKEEYESVLKTLNSQYMTLKNLLPNELTNYIENSLGELKIFNGIPLFPSWTVVKDKIYEYANKFKKEIRDQIRTFEKELEINRENKENIKNDIKNKKGLS